MEPGAVVRSGRAGVGDESLGRIVRLKPDLLQRARVSLTMIVRDEERNLPHCLESVRGVFDEIVVLDTGSRDRTVEIARSFGARVFDFVWVDDFAAARNAALARATGDYAFWLDADDLIEPPERTKLEALLGRLGRGGEMPAFVVRCSCDAGPNGEGGETVVDHIRLFPVIEGVRWTYRVHEQILPALKRAGLPLQWTDITVRHTGYADRDLRSRKLERDSRILLEELAERPDDPFTLFNLGSIAIERTEWNDALEYLKRSLARSAPTDSITRKLFAPDRTSSPDEVRPAVCSAGVRRRAFARPRGRRAVVPQGGRAPVCRRAGRGGTVLAADIDSFAAAEVRQHGPGDLWASHPAQPRGPRYGTRRRSRSRAAVAGGAGGMPG